MVSVKESFFRGQILKVRNIFPEHRINLRHALSLRERISLFDVAALVTYNMIGLLPEPKTEDQTNETMTYT